MTVPREQGIWSQGLCCLCSLLWQVPWILLCSSPGTHTKNRCGGYAVGGSGVLGTGSAWRPGVVEQVGELPTLSGHGEGIRPPGLAEEWKAEGQTEPCLRKSSSQVQHWGWL